MILDRSQVALGILAGGQARRMGGADKALLRHQGERLVDRVLAGAGEGYAQVLLSYNGAQGDELRGQLVPDLRAGHAGPLAGMEALLAACAAPWLLSLPVDIGQVPTGLFERLAECAAEGRGARACDGDGVQPLVALWPVGASRAPVAAALAAGEGAVHRVQAGLGFAQCEFAPARFGNFNTPSDLQA